MNATREKVILAAFSTCAAAMLAGNAYGDDIYSCVDKAGNKRVQSFPCDTDARTVERKMIDAAGRRAKPAAAPQKSQQPAFSQTTLQADAHGQFFLMAQINGAPVRAIIDTGATTVAMNGGDANSMGIDYLRGRRITALTANGPAVAYLVTLASVQVGDILLTNVAGSVIESSGLPLPMVLIGMSFLREVDMQRSGNTMVLQRRN